MVILLFWNIPHTQTLRWGPFTAPYGNDFPNLAYAYDSDIRTRGINDGVRSILLFSSFCLLLFILECLALGALQDAT